MNADFYYDQGDMPTKFYNQLNGKTEQENYNRTRRLHIRKRKKKRSDGDVFSAMLDSIKPEMMIMLRACIESGIDEITRTLK